MLYNDSAIVLLEIGHLMTEGIYRCGKRTETDYKETVP